jgi:predicted RNA-binding Zn-ribbon protein involved in translation (DUF1610 family)
MMATSSTTTPICPECEKPISFEKQANQGVVYACRRCGTTTLIAK